MSAPLKLFGTVGGVDKTGIINIQVKFWVATLPECYRYVPTDLGITLPLMSRTFSQSEGGPESTGEAGYEVTLHYEGAEVDFKYADNQITFEFDASMAEEPIESHPSFDKIATKYGWDAAKKKGVPSLNLSHPHLDKEGKGWVVIEIEVDEDKWKTTKAAVIQVDSLKSTEKLKGRHPIAYLTQESDTDLKCFQVEYFNIQHRTDGKDKTPTRHFFWPV